MFREIFDLSIRVTNVQILVVARRFFGCVRVIAIGAGIRSSWLGDRWTRPFAGALTDSLAQRRRDAEARPPGLAPEADCNAKAQGRQAAIGRLSLPRFPVHTVKRRDAAPSDSVCALAAWRFALRSGENRVTVGGRGPSSTGLRHLRSLIFDQYPCPSV